jgi:microcompartment protein CcmL/EutN
VEAGREVAAEALVDSIVIPNVDKQVIVAIAACTQTNSYESLGIIETFSLASAILCADTAVKAADISLIEIRLGRGLGGKSFITLTGDVAAVRYSVETAAHLDETQGMVARTVVIPSPHPDILKAIF